MSFRDWLERRERGALAWWGRSFRSLPYAGGARLGLFCDFEGGYAGPAGEQYAERGTDLLLGLLDRHQVRMTFNVVAELCRTQARRVRRVIDAGHEVACHGWRHERPRDLSAEALDQMLGSAGECFADVGVRPVGFRSPRSAWSVPLLKALVSRGYRWNAERDRSGWPYRIVPGLVRVGVTTDDWDLSDEASPVSGLMSKWARCVEQAAWCGQDVSIGVHEWLIGRRGEYAAALDGFLAEVRGRAGLKLETLGGLAGV